MSKPYLTTPEVAKMWRVSRERVVGWIRSGQLVAMNTNPSGKIPRYVIDPQDLERFKQTRTVPPEVPKPQRRRPMPGVKQFY